MCMFHAASSGSDFSLSLSHAGREAASTLSVTPVEGQLLDLERATGQREMLESMPI